MALSIGAINSAGTTSAQQIHGAKGTVGTSSSVPGQDKSQQPMADVELCGGTTGFIMMIMMFFTMILMFDIELRRSIAQAMNGFFEPIFAFDYMYPVLTLLLASIFMVSFSTTIRHFMTDWVELARIQKFMNAYQKEKMDAMTSGNTVKLKKLEEMTPEISQNNMKLMASNLRPVAFTMIFFIIVFPWVWMIYIEELSYHYVTIPGTNRWDLWLQPDWCIFPWGQWIFIYILLSFPISFLIQSGLKYFTFTRRIKLAEVDKTKNLQVQIKELEQRITSESNSGIPTDRARELISSARTNLEEKNYYSASTMLKEADEYLDRKVQSNKRIMSLFAEAEKMIANADKKGVNVAEAIKSLEFAKKALKRNDDTSAIYYAKQSSRQVKESKQQHKEAEAQLSSIKAFMYDLRDIDTKEADEIFTNAERAMADKDYSEVLKYSKATKQKAEEISNQYKDAKQAIDKAKTEVDNLVHLELVVPKANEIFQRANQAFKSNKYSETIELSEQCLDVIRAERGKFQNAQESVSFAKLVTSNAISFGASIPDAEKYVAEAESALTQKRYDKAIELATKAKNIAEAAKRQQQRLAKRR